MSGLVTNLTIRRISSLKVVFFVHRCSDAFTDASIWSVHLVCVLSLTLVPSALPCNTRCSMESSVHRGTRSKKVKMRAWALENGHCSMFSSCLHIGELTMFSSSNTNLLVQNSIHDFHHPFPAPYLYASIFFFLFSLSQGSFLRSYRKMGKIRVMTSRVCVASVMLRFLKFAASCPAQIW